MKIIIAGAGEVGSHLAKMLSNESNDLTVIDSDQERLDALSENTDVVTVTGNPSSIRVLKEAGVEDADLFIAVNPSTSQDVNIVSAMLAKKLGSKKATARVNYEEYLSYENKYLFTEMGIDLLFYPEKIAAGEIVDLLKRTASTESMDFARGKLQMAVFKLEEDSPMIDMRLIDFVGVATPSDLPFRVVAMTRNSETIIPSVDTKFKYHDLVFIISKIVPSWVIGMAVFTLGVLIVWLFYGITPRGSYVSIYLLTFLFLVAMVGFGIWISLLPYILNASALSSSTKMTRTLPFIPNPPPQDPRKSACLPSLLQASVCNPMK